jgi:hypothetical protein
MRVLLLRILISWWAIPAAWLIMFPISLLLFGDKEYSMETCINFTKAVWFGDA